MGYSMVNGGRVLPEQIVKPTPSAMRSRLLKFALLMTVLLAFVFCFVSVSLSFPGRKEGALHDDGRRSEDSFRAFALYAEDISLEVITMTMKSLVGKGVSKCVQRCMSAAGPPCVEAGRGLADDDGRRTPASGRGEGGGRPPLWQKVRSKEALGMEVDQDLVANDAGDSGGKGNKKSGEKESDKVVPSAASAEHAGADGDRKGDSQLANLVSEVKKLALTTNARKQEMYFNLGQDDIELLELAVKKTNYMRRVALLFLTDGPFRLAPVWENYLRGYEDFYSLYVHQMPRFELIDNVSGPFAGRQIKSENVDWGRMDLVDAQRRLLANAIMNPLNQRFIILSGSSVPVTDFRAMYHYLMDTGDSFVEASAVAKQQHDGKLRSIVRRREFEFGSQWVALTRKHATLIVKDRTFYPAFARNCVGIQEDKDALCTVGLFSQWCREKPHVACHPDEHYIQTVIDSLAKNELNRRSIMWTHRDSPWDLHPVAWNAEKLRANSTLLESIREQRSCLWNGQEKECYLFAHKFAPDTVPLLLEKGQQLGLWD
ncbi:hypothetical protein CBR_g39820 [Chara braunii]|uniref:Uncharacterized protein n=1 Tax=Chara braunii TaxID=69332 RepID=A0A388LSE5_CHABU|nr:hypothetical protein CBR_g39820 [Chara braunii]|eukprot:GBG85254.1 hypothetical protein CBR_g39820 [Chara braunii]